MPSTLSGQVKGPVLEPGDDGYAEEILAFNRATTHTPDLVVGAESADDVAAAVRHARDNGMRVTIQATGHGAEKPVTGGLMITTHRLDSLEVDPATRTATLGAGVKWGQVVAAAAPHGLAPVTGAAATVGAVGLLLGGGVGPLGRSHGLVSDYATGFTVVTGTGEVVEASATDNPDLFWALRGGKFGLGVVTEMRVRLVELSSLYGGTLFFEEGDIERVLRTWVDWTATADERVTTSVAIARFPDFEAVPPPLRGRTLLALRFAYPGPVDEGARLASPLREAAPVYLDMLGEIPASEIARIHNDPTEPSPSWVQGMLISRVDQDFATVLLDHFGPRADSPFVATELRHVGSATRRDVDGGSAAGGRSADFVLALVGVIPDLFPVMPGAADRWSQAAARWIAPENTINAMGQPVTPERVAICWPAPILARLEEVRRRYDPDTTFATP